MNILQRIRQRLLCAWNVEEVLSGGIGSPESVGLIPWLCKSWYRASFPWHTSFLKEGNVDTQSIQPIAWVWAESCSWCLLTSQCILASDENTSNKQGHYQSQDLHSLAWLDFLPWIESGEVWNWVLMCLNALWPISLWIHAGGNTAPTLNSTHCLKKQNAALAMPQDSFQSWRHFNSAWGTAEMCQMVLLNR